jgi:hypothetical protein
VRGDEVLKSAGEALPASALMPHRIDHCEFIVTALEAAKFELIMLPEERTR